MRKKIFLPLLLVLVLIPTLVYSWSVIVAGGGAGEGWSTIWTAESQTGDSTWGSKAFGNAADKNVRVHIQNAYITSNAVTLRITFKSHATEDSTLSDAGIGLKGDGSGEDVYDWETGNSPTAIKFNSGNDSVTLTAGDTIVSDNVTFSITASEDYLVAMWTSNYYFGFLTGNQIWWASGVGSSDVDVADISGYTQNAEVFTVQKIEKYE